MTKQHAILYIKYAIVFTLLRLIEFENMVTCVLAFITSWLVIKERDK